MKTVKIYDTTLREGMQRVGTSFSLGDKMQLALLLDSIGVSYIEGGFPGGSPKDMAFYRKMKDVTLKNSKLVAFGPTVKAGIAPEDDPMIQALLEAETACVAIFGKCNINQVIDVLNVTPDDNIRMIKDTVKYLKDNNKYVFFDAEHFFSGMDTDAAYALSCIAAAKDAGADVVVLCDTNGGMLPDDIEKSVKIAKNSLGETAIGIHAHNDTGCADYSTLKAVTAGCDIAQVTVNGWGERCGNANLFTVVPNLKLKLGYDCVKDLTVLYDAAHKASEIANIKTSEFSPYVGRNAFSHKAGVHIDAVMKNSSSYEHISPETVGNTRKFMLSEQSGRAAVLAKLDELLPRLGASRETASSIAEQVKEMELRGYQFENADASFEMMVKRLLKIEKKWFSLNNYRVVAFDNAEEGKPTASAIVDLTVDNREEITAANGIGPVDALDGALRKALSVFYPEISKIRLEDYKVRVLESRMATASVVRVVIEFTDGERNWCTVGVSGDIIQASFNALVDNYEYFLDNK